MQSSLNRPGRPGRCRRWPLTVMVALGLFLVPGLVTPLAGQPGSYADQILS